jgi:hypothetical protein
MKGGAKVVIEPHRHAGIFIAKVGLVNLRVFSEKPNENIDYCMHGCVLSECSNERSR